MWDGFEYKHPEEEINWNNLYKLVDFVKNTSNPNFYAQYQSKFYLDNLVDYFIFLNVLRAIDNTGKNLFIAKYNTNEPYFYVPWDLDIIFGNYWGGGQDNTTTGLLSNGLYNRLWDDCSENGFRSKLQTRWEQVKQTIFNHDFLMNMFEENYTFLLNNGAYEREEIAWNVIPQFNHLDYMSGWITDRLAWLDEKFNEDCDIRSSINHNEFANKNIRIYPNPAADYIYFDWNDSGTIDVLVYDVQGKLLLSEQLSSSQDPLAVSSLDNGIYIVKFTNKKTRKQENIYKQLKLVISK